MQLRFGFCWFYIALAGASQRHGSGRVSLLQVGRSALTGSAPDFDFFDDVPAQVLQDAKVQGGHHALSDSARVTSESLAVGDATSTHHKKPKPVLASLLAAADASLRRANELSQVHAEDEKRLSRMAPLKGMEKPPPVSEEADDPRAVGFGVQSHSVGGGIIPDRRVASKSREASAWDLLEYARVGARAAFSSAVPKWYGRAAAQDKPPQAVETEEHGEVDRSAQFTPGAAALIARTR